MNGLKTIAEQFIERGETVHDVRLLGRGNINDTYLVSLGGREHQRFVLQRVNSRVFPHPERVMRNIRILTEHVSRRMEQSPLTAGRRWEIPRVILTRAGEDHWIGGDGSFWRALSYIDGASSHDTVQNLDHAAEFGRALGLLHRFMSDLDPRRLTDTLPGFHVTPDYLRDFDFVVAKVALKSSAEARYCLQFIERYRSRVALLEDAKARGELSNRAIHGDPKVDNVMMDMNTGRAVGMVDLDTVKPGLIQHDVGDCLRSGCNTAGEDAENRQSVRFDVDLARAIMTGYFEEARHFLTASDRAYFYDAVLLIAFELGLRFFTDHLAGNVYFKVKHGRHNLQRALVQFRLVESIEAREGAIRPLFRDL